MCLGVGEVTYGQLLPLVASLEFFSLNREENMVVLLDLQQIEVWWFSVSRFTV
jgi:hypothetical protein